MKPNVLNTQLLRKCGLKLAHFYWTSVYYTLPILETLRYGILCHHCLTGASMRRYQDTLIPLDSIYRNLLERIEGEFVFPSGF